MVVRLVCELVGAVTLFWKFLGYDKKSATDKRYIQISCDIGGITEISDGYISKE